jgi:hypothetical protein
MRNHDLSVRWIFLALAAAGLLLLLSILLAIAPI